MSFLTHTITISINHCLCKLPCSVDLKLYCISQRYARWDTKTSDYAISFTLDLLIRIIIISDYTLFDILGLGLTRA